MSDLARANKQAPASRRWGSLESVILNQLTRSEVHSQSVLLRILFGSRTWRRGELSKISLWHFALPRGCFENAFRLFIIESDQLFVLVDYICKQEP